MVTHNRLSLAPHMQDHAQHSLPCGRWNQETGLTGRPQRCRVLGAGKLQVINVAVQPHVSFAAA